MMLIGDVLAVIALLVGIGVTGWAVLIGLSVLSPIIVGRARTRIELDPRGTGVNGIFWMLYPLAGLAISAIPSPITKLTGLLLVGQALIYAAIGVAAVAEIMADRIEAGAGVTRWMAVLRSSGIIAAAVQLPVLGWFFILPVLLLVGLGAGFPAVLNLVPRRARQNEA